MRHSLANPRPDFPKIGQEGSKVYLGFVYGGVEHEIKPGKEHRLPRVWLQQQQPGIRAHHPVLALPDPWHKQDTRMQHLVELGTSLFCMYKSFRFLAKEQKDRQTNKMLPSTRQDAATDESPSQHRGEYTISLCLPKGRCQPCCICWSGGTRLQQLQPQEGKRGSEQQSEDLPLRGEVLVSLP